MRHATDPDSPCTEYLDQLRKLPFITEAKLHEPPNSPTLSSRPAVNLAIRTARGSYEFHVELKRTHLTRALVAGMLATIGNERIRDWILFAPHVGRPLASYLAERGGNYIDKAGNCRLVLGEDHYAFVQGQRRKEPEPRGRGVGLAGYQVLFAILAQPELLDAPTRTLALAAGVAMNTASRALTRLAEEGLIGAGTGHLRILDRQTMLDRWIAAYADQIRPRQFVGAFRTPDADPPGLEQRVEREFPDTTAWAWGGTAAAKRLNGIYRGPTTVLHVRHWNDDAARRLKALRAKDGPLIVLRTRGELAFNGIVPQTVHPLLVYAELLTSGDPRSTEAAEEIRSLYLPT